MEVATDIVVLLVRVDEEARIVQLACGNCIAYMIVAQELRSLVWASDFCGGLLAVAEGFWLLRRASGCFGEVLGVAVGACRILMVPGVCDELSVSVPR